MEEIYKNLSLENLENEIWRNIEGYENYQVSNMGRVKSLDYLHTKEEKILKQGKKKDGYLFVILCKEGKKKNCYVHRLVALSFLDNPNGYRCVNHKDENPSNNIVNNLEWCTYQYNSNYGTCIQRRVENTDWKRRVENTDWKRKVENTDYKAIAAKIDYKEIGRKSAEKQSKQVFQYDKNGTLIKIWQSTQQCGRNGYNAGNVAACCRGKLKHYKGYLWSYTEIN